jgi:hypothetical protein
MPKSKDELYFVIAGSPLPQSGTSGYCAFYSPAGKIVHNKLDAETFLTFQDAEDFAKQHKIILADARCVTRISFSSQERELYWQRKER